jgi:hypothetical protein
MATRVASIVADVGINTKSFDSGIKSILSGLGLSKGEFAKWGTAIGVAGIAIGAIYSQMKKAVDVTVSYADEVRKLSSVTNQSAEDTSRLIQMMDDYKLTAEQAGQAARFMAKNDLSLNVDTLAQLSDEYKTLNTGQERATFLMKNFGKQGQEFTTIMEAGGEAIKKNAAATDKNLILTQKMLTATRDYEIAQDNLNDTMEGFYIVTGSKIVPSLNNMIVGLTNAGDFSRALRIEIEKIENAPIDSATQSYMAWASSIKTVAIAAGDVDDVIRGISDAEESFLLSTQEMTPQAVAEFVKLEQKIAQVKRMIAAGASFNVIVNFLAGKTIMVDPSSMAPGQNPGASQTTVNTTTTNTNVGAGAGAGGREQLASGGFLGKGWSMVGEAGFELIDPSGMVHSNAESRKLMALGIVPGRKLAQGGDDQMGGVTNDYYATNLINDLVQGNYNPLSGLSGGADPQGGGRSGGLSGANGRSASSAVINASQKSAQAAQQSAQASNKMADVAQQNSAMQQASNLALIAEVRQLRVEFPRAVRDAVQQAIAQ